MKTKHDLKELHNFIELISDLVFVKNIKGQYTHVNNAFINFLNKKREDILFKTDYDLFRKEVAIKFVESDKKILETKINNNNIEDMIINDDNSISYFDSSKQILYDLEDNEVGLFCIAKDTTVKKEYEIIYQDNKKLLENIAIEKNLKKTLNNIVIFAENRSKGTKCSILLLDKSKQYLLNGAAPSLPDFYNNAIEGLKIGEKVGSCGSAAFKRERVIIENIDTHENWQPYLELTKKAGLHASWSQPIFSSNNEIIGTFAMYNTMHKAPSDFELKLISAYSNMASVAIEKDNTYKQILENEYQLAQLFNNTQSGLIHVDKNRNIVKANDRFYEISGYESADEIIGKNTSKLYLSKESYNKFEKKAIQQLKYKKVLNVEYQFIKKDGSVIWCEVSGKRLNKSLQLALPDGILYTINDISLKKSYERKLKNSELLNKSILATIPDIIWLKDKNGIFITCNHEFERFFGASKEDIIGKTDYDFKDKKTSDSYKLHDKIAMDSIGPVKNEELISYFSNKKKILLETTKIAMRDNNGNIIGVLGIGHDITKREEELEELERLNKLSTSLSEFQASLLSLFDKGDSVLFKWQNNDDWEIEYLSNSIVKLLGYSKDDFMSRRIRYEDCIHKNDIDNVKKEVKNALENDLRYFKHEPYRLIHKDGEERWILDYTVLQKDSNNNITHFIGYVTDITEQKKQQDIIFQQSKIASMGEMIGNIAHQWRQPLSIISSIATASKLEKELGILSDEQFEEHMGIINKNTQYLSETIENFRQFIKADRELSDFNLSSTIKSFLSVIDSTIKKSNVEIVLNLDDNIILVNYQNDLIQTFINILNNSIEAFEQKEEKKKYFFISTKKEDKKTIIKLKDNAGGIEEELITRVFEPYITSKNKSLGTGLGLNISYNFIVQGMNGKIFVENTSFKYDNKEYKGCEFTIIFNNYYDS